MGRRRNSRTKGDIPITLLQSGDWRARAVNGPLPFVRNAETYSLLTASLSITRKDRTACLGRRNGNTHKVLADQRHLVIDVCRLVLSYRFAIQDVSGLSNIATSILCWNNSLSLFCFSKILL